MSQTVAQPTILLVDDSALFRSFLSSYLRAMSRNLDLTLTQIQRTMQDAVAAEDEEGLKRADGLRDGFLADFEKGRTHPVIDGGRIDALRYSGVRQVLTDATTKDRQELQSAISSLSELNKTQPRSLPRQASGLAEASATTQELKQTSSVAATKAETVRHVAVKTEELSASGQQAVEASIEGLQSTCNGLAQMVGAFKV